MSCKFISGIFLIALLGCGNSDVWDEFIVEFECEHSGGLVVEFIHCSGKPSTRDFNFYISGRFVKRYVFRKGIFTNYLILFHSPDIGASSITGSIDERRAFMVCTTNVLLSK